jgi:uncharacterized protein YndB with AHSA1/START domain
VTIRAPAEKVFGFLTDLDRVPEWDPRISRVTSMTRGPLRAGGVLRSFLSVGGETVHADDEITDYDPPNRFGVRSVAGGSDSVTYNLAEDDHGQTLVEVDLAYDLPDAPTKDETRSAELRAAIAEALEHSLHTLKELVERDCAHHP